MNGAEAERIEEHYTPSIEVVELMIMDYFEQRHGRIIDYVDRRSMRSISRCR